MKRKIYSSILSIGIFISIIVACQSESISLKEMINNTFLGNYEKEIVLAQSWYRSRDPMKILSRSTDSHPLFEDMIPFWEEAFTGLRGKVYTIETPIATTGRKLIATSQASKKYKETEDSRFIQSFTRLVIKVDEKKRDTVGFFMTIIPSVDYMLETKFNPFNNTYFHRDRAFSGYIIFHELDGRLANGWKYFNGMITRSVHSPDRINASQQVRGVNCITYCQDEYWERCTTFHSVTEWGDVITDKKCTYEYLRTVCWEECTPTIDPVNPDGGTTNPDGGYHPDACPICGSVPCVCPKEIDCDETASKNIEHVQSLWAAFISNGLKENFIDKYIVLS